MHRLVLLPSAQNHRHYVKMMRIVRHRCDAFRLRMNPRAHGLQSCSMKSASLSVLHSLRIRPPFSLPELIRIGCGVVVRLMGFRGGHKSGPILASTGDGFVEKLIAINHIHKVDSIGIRPHGMHGRYAVGVAAMATAMLSTYALRDDHVINGVRTIIAACRWLYDVDLRGFEYKSRRRCLLWGPDCC